MHIIFSVRASGRLNVKEKDGDAVVHEDMPKDAPDHDVLDGKNHLMYLMIL